MHKLEATYTLQEKWQKPGWAAFQASELLNEQLTVTEAGYQTQPTIPPGSMPLKEPRAS